ncbi:hypothetical protein SAMN05421754_1002127 [Nitrosomonas sp. Nm58]|nr:hypothetical protein SAMN05421754_1002127 [Nitrosomonas sp. Nm58]
MPEAIFEETRHWQKRENSLFLLVTRYSPGIREVRGLSSNVSH